MSNTRVKAAAIAPPASLEAAQVALGEIGAMDRVVASIEARLESDITALRARAELEVKAINGHIEARFRGLQAYVEVNREALILKDRESVTWPTGTVGFRKTPLKVSVAKAKFDDIVAELQRRKLRRCLRVKTEIDKDTLKSLRGKVEDIEGLRFTSRTEFFAKPTDAKIEHVRAVKPPKPIKVEARGTRP